MSPPAVLGYRIFRFHGAGTPLKFPIVLLRGLGRSSGFWLDFSEKLSEHANVVCVDLLGTGLSPSEAGRGTISGFADDVEKTLTSLGYSQVFLVGISLGGMVAMEFSSKSSRVAKLAVLASSSRGTGEARIKPKALLALLWSLRLGTPANAELAPYLVSRETLMSRPDLPQVWDRLWRQEGFKTIPVLRQLIAAALYRADNALARIKVPILFMVSRADSLVPWQNTLRLWEKANDCQLMVLDDYGHDFPTEAPELVISHLIEFFNSPQSR